MVKTVAGGGVSGQQPERWWMHWGAEEPESDSETDAEIESETMQPTSLWEAEITALDDEQLMALEDSGEDD